MYSIHKIKRKRIKLTKEIQPDKEQYYEGWRMGMQERITELKAEGYRIIYLDECLITTKALLMSDYTNLNTKHRIQMAKVSQPAYQVILAISEENGLEHCGYYTKSGDTKRFKEYINEPYVANKDAKIAVLMDNLGVHKSP